MHPTFFNLHRASVVHNRASAACGASAKTPRAGVGVAPARSPRRWRGGQRWCGPSGASAEARPARWTFALAQESGLARSAAALARGMSIPNGHPISGKIYPVRGTSVVAARAAPARPRRTRFLGPRVGGAALCVVCDSCNRRGRLSPLPIRHTASTTHTASTHRHPAIISGH